MEEQEKTHLSGHRRGKRHKLVDDHIQMIEDDEIPISQEQYDSAAPAAGPKQIDFGPEGQQIVVEDKH